MTCDDLCVCACLSPLSLSLSPSLYLSLSLSLCLSLCVCVSCLSDQDPGWSSLFLALGSDVSQYVPPSDGVPQGAPSPAHNLLRLHRAVDANWPVNRPEPYLFANASFGSRLFRQPAYARLRKELPFAKRERVSEGHSALVSKGVLISGNAGVGKVRSSSHSRTMQHPRLPHSPVLTAVSIARVCPPVICRVRFSWIICTSSFIL